MYLSLCHKLPQLVNFARRSRHYSVQLIGCDTLFLRMMAGAGNGCIEVLLRYLFNRRPVMHRWVMLAGRWFTDVEGSMPPYQLTH
jgi:hypothetical protein